MLLLLVMVLMLLLPLLLQIERRVRVPHTPGDGVPGRTDPGLQRLPAAGGPELAGPLLLDAHPAERVPVPRPQLRATGAQPPEHLGHGAGALSEPLSGSVLLEWFREWMWFACCRAEKMKREWYLFVATYFKALSPSFVVTV